MKKIWLLMLMVCTVIGTFTACSSDDDGDSTPQLPVSGVNIPTSAAVGSEVIIRGSGFAASGVNLYLENSSKERTKMDAAFSNSGVTFTVPMTLVSGVYNVILTQSGNEWALGSITLTDADSPIISPSLPEMVVNPGKEVTLGGSGYESGDKIVLKAEGAEDIEISEVTISTDGLTFTLSADCPEGEYTVSLVRGTNSWVLDNIVLTVQKAKRVKSILMQGILPPVFLQMEYNEKGQLTKITEEEGEWAFEYENNTISTVGVMTMEPITYTLEKEKIKKSDFLGVLTEGQESNGWSYDNGYLSSITNGVLEDDNMQFIYGTDGNLKELAFPMMNYTVQYTYGTTSVKTVPNTIDPAVAIHLLNMFYGKEDVFLAFLLNQVGQVSKKIPDSINYEDGQISDTYDIKAEMSENILYLDCTSAWGNGMVNLTITYEDIED